MLMQANLLNFRECSYKYAKGEFNYPCGGWLKLEA